MRCLSTLRFPLLLVLGASLALLAGSPLWGKPLKVASFSVDASPPIGSPLAYDPTKAIQEPLSCRGVIVQAEQTVVLCAIDWIGIANSSYDNFRTAIAEAVGTRPELVAVHALHQHDAPRADATTAEIMKEFDLPNLRHDAAFVDDVVARTAAAAKKALDSLRPVTHLGLGEAAIEKVASNRRILGPDGKVKYVRFTATKDPVIRDQPIGTIDPMCKLISFWQDDQPLIVMTYYATHPQSYYRTGLANPDFPGMARNDREATTGVFHIHFNGAGGNIGAGKWNDGAKENRQILADRVAEGMRKAWEASRKTPIDSSDVAFKAVNVHLPAAHHLDEEALVDQLKNPQEGASALDRAARELAWLRRCQANDPISVSCLTLGPARVLHLPGELFVEYQLAAQKMRPELFVAMAAYGDYAPGYIGTEIAYSQGGYETSPRASRVSSRVEQVLITALNSLLDGEEGRTDE